MESSRRNRTRLFGFKKADLERYLIKEMGLPEDIVVMEIVSSINQDAWIIKVHSSEFETSGDLDFLPADVIAPVTSGFVIQSI